MLVSIGHAFDLIRYEVTYGLYEVKSGWRWPIGHSLFLHFGSLGMI